jgi:hypothetical protein
MSDIFHGDGNPRVLAIERGEFIALDAARTRLVDDAVAINVLPLRFSETPNPENEFLVSVGVADGRRLANLGNSNRLVNALFFDGMNNGEIGKMSRRSLSLGTSAVKSMVVDMRVSENGFDLIGRPHWLKVGVKRRSPDTFRDEMISNRELKSMVNDVTIQLNKILGSKSCMDDRNVGELFNYLSLLAANVVMGRYMAENNLRGIFMGVISADGLDQYLEEHTVPSDLAVFLRQVGDTSRMRRRPTSFFSTTPVPNSTLAGEPYSPVTSPLRRHRDVANQLVVASHIAGIGVGSPLHPLSNEGLSRYADTLNAGVLSRARARYEPISTNIASLLIDASHSFG